MLHISTNVRNIKTLYRFEPTIAGSLYMFGDDRITLQIRLIDIRLDIFQKGLTIPSC
jgi:hypothetical protein